MPDITPRASSNVLPLMLCMTDSRLPCASRVGTRLCQFTTASEAGSRTGRERIRIASMKL